MKKSLQEAIIAYNLDPKTSFHIPSHSGRCLDSNFEQVSKSLGYMKIDGAVLEREKIEHFDNKNGRITDLGKPYHDFFNSKLTLYTQNRSTIGNQVMCMCMARKKVAIQINSHISVYNGLIMAGCEIVFISPDYNSEFDVYLPITAKHIEDIKRTDEDVYAFYLTSPSYEGFVIDYASVKKACGDALLLIDEAHGAYCYSSTQMFGGSLQGGADSSVTSLHKSLGGVSGLGMINVGKNSRIDENLVKKSYMLMNTTSTSIYFLLSAESCVLSSSISHKEDQITNIVNLNKYFRQRLNQMKNIEIDSFQEQGYKFLPNKTLIKIKGLGGQKFFNKLLKKNVRVEKSTLTAILVTISLLNNQHDIDHLIQEIQNIDNEIEKNGIVNGITNNEIEDQQSLLQKLLSNRKIVWDIRDVFGSKNKVVSPSESVGNISADMVSRCPPGYPVLTYGEQVTEHHLCFIQEEGGISIVDDIVI
eukprot:TRINITY_DN3624_c0_g1_i1.p1 TRINITY_DN3624_c0_g1~~TRINITY_DN3624_c0_g1_i1.p1  ORF type:complete len:482 (-),score=48.69 TRINITY_DN3624_c0_g1_i1:467-1888(-)